MQRISSQVKTQLTQSRKENRQSDLPGVEALISWIPVQRSNQLSWQANWELVIKLVPNISGK